MRAGIGMVGMETIEPYRVLIISLPGGPNQIEKWAARCRMRR